MNIKCQFRVDPPSNSSPWKAGDGIIAVSEDDEVFVSCALTGFSSSEAFLRCAHDGIATAKINDLLMVPISWAIGEDHDLELPLRRLEREALELCALIPPSIPVGPCVYVISDGSGHCKIGKAVDVSKRVRQLQTGNPSRLYVSTVLMCQSQGYASAAESVAHNLLSERKATGEWFRVSERHAEQILYEAASEVGIERNVVQIKFGDEVEA